MVQPLGCLWHLEKKRLLKPVLWTLAEFYFNRGLQRLYTGTCIILQKTINGFLCLLIVFLKSKTHQLNLKDVIKSNRNLTVTDDDRDKIVADWYERKTVRSALNGTGSKAFTLLRQCLIQVVNKQ